MTFYNTLGCYHLILVSDLDLGDLYLHNIISKLDLDYKFKESNLVTCL